MSLVAYGASDDESDSDNQEEFSSGNAKEPSNQQSTSSKFEEKGTPANVGEKNTLQKSGFAAKLPPPKVTVKRTATHLSSLASLLPKPKNESVRPSFPDTQPGPAGLDLGEEDDIIEIEEEYVSLSMTKKKSDVKDTAEDSKSIGSLFSRMPKPWSWQSSVSLGKKSDSGAEVASSKAKQTVKISAVSMPKQADSDDEDEDKPAPKKFKPSGSGSGLAALLPKPKHSVTVKSNPNKPSAKLSNRPLVPHTLTKKPVAPVKAKAAKPAKKDDDNDSDDDDEGNSGPANFFSFGDKPQSNVELDAATMVKSEIPLPAPEIAPADPNPISKTSTLSQNHREVGDDSVLASNNASSNNYSRALSSSAAYGTNDSTSGNAYGGSFYGSASSSSPSSATYGASNTSDVYGDGFYGGPSGSHQTEATAPYYNYQAYTGNDMNSSANSSQPYYTSYDAPQSHTQVQQPTTDTDQLDMEQLRKLQGKKNRKEQINIIDITAADQTKDVELMLTKMSSEEVAHRPSKKKGNMPTSQQRRKHQITYLAFQAKEKEFELRQQWSANRQTKRQTQSKYGF
ncbi:predicted protein [Nematostella vectensis]|uniref:Proline-rich protein PRCC n=1 Tax=Nematostella vectensis TaxID=45351 RepID=A7SW68_NEMVE|nr:predicted protein [Nematostella vectensis]|eukprot:XP_001624156.1 predicted protein [Nematostella vectensis]